MSPKLRYPAVAGIGTRMSIVETATAAARTTERAILVVVEPRGRAIPNTMRVENRVNI